MGSASSNVARVQQSFYNNITQQDQQNCLATSSTQVNNNTVIINNSKIDGNLTGVSATISTDATCLMVSNMEDSISNILSSTLAQTNGAQTGLFNDFNYTNQDNNINISQSVTNNISQINEATCAANSTTSVSNNYVYVSNTEVGGNFVGVVATSDASANCSMTNTMKNVTYNQAQASATQTNTIQGMFVAIAGIIAAVIGLLVLATIFLFGFYLFSGRRSTPVSAADQELNAAAELGLSPEVLQSLVGNSSGTGTNIPASLFSSTTRTPTTVPLANTVSSSRVLAAAESAV